MVLIPPDWCTFRRDGGHSVGNLRPVKLNKLESSTYKLAAHLSAGCANSASSSSFAGAAGSACGAGSAGETGSASPASSASSTAPPPPSAPQSPPIPPVSQAPPVSPTKFVAHFCSPQKIHFQVSRSSIFTYFSRHTVFSHNPW